MKVKTYGKCILCSNNTLLTKEHIFADWIGEIVPVSHTSTFSELITNQKYKTAYIPQSPSSRTLNILCEKCNNDWGGRLQKKASECLKPFLLGEKLILDDRDCRVIARWATCFAMVREFLHPELSTISQSVRRSFRFKSDHPPAGFAIWVGRFEGSPRANFSSWHRALNFLMTSNVSKVPNTSLIQFAIGKAVFFILYTSALDLQDWSNIYHYAILKYLSSVGMQRIFDNTKMLDFSSSLTITDLAYQNLMDKVCAQLSNPLPMLLSKGQFNS